MLLPRLVNSCAGFLGKMKKATIIAIALIVSAFATQAQTLKPVKKDTSKYTYFVKMPVQDVQQYFQLLTDYKGLVIYDPTKSADEKVKIQQGITGYLLQLQKLVKIDSAKVDGKK